MEACYGGTDVMERSCAVARGIDTNTRLRLTSFLWAIWYKYNDGLEPKRALR
jgi:hypothetical protein